MSDPCAEVVRMVEERDRTIGALKATIREMAERQEHFASDVYPEHDEADRAAFRHAAAMLRAVLVRHEQREVRDE
jgi:hypothetical protein